MIHGDDEDSSKVMGGHDKVLNVGARRSRRAMYEKLDIECRRG